MLLVMRPFEVVGGGIGNYLFHLGHCILYAQIREATLVVPRPVAYRTLNERAVALDFSETPDSTELRPEWWDGRPIEAVPRSYDPARIEVLGGMLHGNELTREVSFELRHLSMQEHVVPLFDPGARHLDVDDDTLVVHVRSGDIFEAEPNHKYPQPPLSWYRWLIERAGFDRVVVVTQLQITHGDHNPVLGEIARRWPHVEIVSHEVEHDFHTLRHARHLALSTSTFSTAAAMTAVGLRTLHVPRWPRPADSNITGAFPEGSRLGFTRFDYRIDGYEEMSSWRNSPEQREMMLGHSIDDIDCTAVG